MSSYYSIILVFSVNFNLIPQSKLISLQCIPCYLMVCSFFYYVSYFCIDCYSIYKFILMDDLHDCRPTFSSDVSTSTEGSSSQAIGSSDRVRDDCVEEHVISWIFASIGVLEAALALLITYSLQNIIKLPNIPIIHRKKRSWIFEKSTASHKP